MQNIFTLKDLKSFRSLQSIEKLLGNTCAVNVQFVYNGELN